ncbi:serine dehydratase-like [Branchiostoma floridae]|uniref:L-serine ammonia-lyase n=1 Tax=Branchiostoma floridae TaxID=7739 RepID=A0A9J7LWP2_BRAFL|nr:serine dehydratase-like [Branchiostoma floridae]
MSYKDKLYINTPLLESHPLSKHAGITVYLKLENVQPSATFKIRGISHLCQKALKEGAKHFVCSSGGNAGLAAAYSARKLGVPATIIVPESTPTFAVERLRGEGATVKVGGKVWDDSNQHTLKLAQQPGYVYIPPFDHPVICKELAKKPGAIICTVGEGGLLSGVVAGLRKVGWTDVPVVAMETKGADSFNAAVTAGKLVTIPDITSVAKCLGAKTVAQEAFNLSKQHPIHSVVVTDEEAVGACAKFLDDERLLVEPACGAALAAIYSPVISRLQDQGRLPGGVTSVVVVVCGGNNITLKQLETWKGQLGLT